MNSNLLMEFFFLCKIAREQAIVIIFIFQTLYRHMRLNLIHITLKTDIFFHESRRILFSELSISFWHPRFSLSDKNICFVFHWPKKAYFYPRHVSALVSLHFRTLSELKVSVVLQRNICRWQFPKRFSIVTEIKLLKTNASPGVYCYSTCLLGPETYTTTLRS